MWVQQLLLEALQASGSFRTPGDSMTAERALSRAPGANARFVPEALGILTRAGATASCLSNGPTTQQCNCQACRLWVIRVGPAVAAITLHVFRRLPG